MRALILAQVFAGLAIFLTTTFVMLGTGFSESVFQPFSSRGMPLNFSAYSASPVEAFFKAVHLLVGGWTWLASSRAGNMRSMWLCVLAAVVVFSLVVFRIALLVASRHIKRNWQDLPPSRRQLWLLRYFCTPSFLKSLFKRKMNRALQANPIGWLQQYSWSARLSKWGWCLFIVVAESVFTSGHYNRFSQLEDIQPWLAACLIIGATFSAASSFRQERQNGALELLLVTPLSEAQIILGRLWGMWKQLVPAAFIFFLAAIGFAHAFSRHPDLNWLVGVATTFLSVPIIGLFFSLRLKNYLASWMATILTATLIPYFLVGMTAYFSQKMGSRLFEDFEDAIIVMILIQLVFAVLTGVLLFRNLKRRTFALSLG